MWFAQFSKQNSLNAIKDRFPYIYFNYADMECFWKVMFHAVGRFQLANREIFNAASWKPEIVDIP